MSILPLYLLGFLGFTSVRQNLQKNIHEQNFEQVTVIADGMRDFVTNVENSLILTRATSAYALVGKDETLRQIILEYFCKKSPLSKKLRLRIKIITLSIKSLAKEEFPLIRL